KTVAALAGIEPAAGDARTYRREAAAARRQRCRPGALPITRKRVVTPCSLKGPGADAGDTSHAPGVVGYDVQASDAEKWRCGIRNGRPVKCIAGKIALYRVVVAIDCDLDRTALRAAVGSDISAGDHLCARICKAQAARQRKAKS